MHLQENTAFTFDLGHTRCYPVPSTSLKHMHLQSYLQKMPPIIYDTYIYKINILTYDPYIYKESTLPYDFNIWQENRHNIWPIHLQGKHISIWL